MRIPSLLLLLAVALHVSAQNESDTDLKFPKALIKLSPLKLFNNTFEIGFETFNPSFSKGLQATVGFRSGSNEFDKGKGISAEVAYRKYVLPMELRSRKGRDFYQGIYYSLFLGGEYFEGKSKSTLWDGWGNPIGADYSVEISAVSPGFTIGLQKTIWKVLVLDVFVGGGVRFSKSHYTGSNYIPSYQGILDPGYDGIYPKFGAKIGVGL